MDLSHPLLSLDLGFLMWKVRGGQDVNTDPFQVVFTSKFMLCCLDPFKMREESTNFRYSFTSLPLTCVQPDGLAHLCAKLLCAFFFGKGLSSPSFNSGLEPYGSLWPQILSLPSVSTDLGSKRALRHCVVVPHTPATCRCLGRRRKSSAFELERNLN